MRIKKILEISTQHEEEVKKAIEFNKKNNYEYVFVDTNNLIEYKNLAYLLRVGYVMSIGADCLELRHKNYDYEKEKEID